MPVWRTGLFGKSHLQHGESRGAVTDFGQAPGVSSPFAEGWDTIEHQERYENGGIVAPDDFYGFGRIELCVGHGSMTGAHHYQWARAKGIGHDALRSGLDPEADIAGRREEWWQIHPAPFSEDASSTAFVTERTIDFIESCEAADEPWMAWCSYPDPHHPLSPPEPWFSRHDPADIELPATFADPGDDWAPHLGLLRSLDPSRAGHGQYVIPFGLTLALTRAAIAVTYGMIEAIDNGVGQILETLDRLGAGGGPIPLKTRTVVTDTHRYTRDSNGFEMLYDLDADPWELTNLASAKRDPETRNLMTNVMVDALIRADDLTRTEPVSP